MDCFIIHDGIVSDKVVVAFGLLEDPVVASVLSQYDRSFVWVTHGVAVIVLTPCFFIFMVPPPSIPFATVPNQRIGSQLHELPYHESNT